MKHPSNTSKQGRRANADLVAALLTKEGVEFTRDEEEPGSMFRARRKSLNLRCERGLCLSVNFDGASSQPDTYVLSWHMDLASDARLSNAFGNINPHHRRKSTDVCYGVSDVLTCLEKRLAQIKSGEAFL